MTDLCPISILVPAKNEAANLRACLDSCRFADDIVVVDSNSTDGTQEIAQQFGARVINFAWNGEFPKKKNWALRNVTWKHEWVFILDADERITPRLADDIRAAIKQSDCDGYYVNRRFWFLDGWLMHSGYYPSWNLRLFKHRLGRYEQFVGVSDTNSGDNEVHEHVLIDGSIGRLAHDMEHFAFPTIDVWIEKHNRYSNWEARLLCSAGGLDTAASSQIDATLARKRRLKRVAARLPFRPTLRFLYHYIWRAGFLDGYRGFVFCRLMGIYEFLSVSKAHELQRTQRQ
jgi:glycosyltransferase involved in cell wall biosynthesis